MSWRVVSRPEIEDDIADAASWYEQQQAGLGAELVREVEAAYAAISQSPLLGAKKLGTKPIRWRLTHKFPYRVIYQVYESAKCVVVLAVMHTARHERRWQRRSD